MEYRDVTRIIIEENQEHGFESYRVPGIVTVSGGDLLLTYEGRGRDGNRRTLFLRRCRKVADGAELIVEPRMVMAEPTGDELLHNPLLIAGSEGRVYFFWCQDYGRLFMRESKDGGESFGAVRELTQVMDGFRKDWPVTLWAIAPGHGICKKDGILVLPLWLSKGENAHLPACFACISSADGGETWSCSNVVPAGNGVGDPTEASVAERSDGTLLATMRHEIPGVRRRAFCEGWSQKTEVTGNAESAGITERSEKAGRICWSEAWLNRELPDPICSGALCSLSDGKMAFVNCAYGDEPALELQRQGQSVRWSLDARQRLTVRISKDDGKTWMAGYLLEQEGGASDLAAGDGQELYCFYEEGWLDGNCIFNRRLKLAKLCPELACGRKG